MEIQGEMTDCGYLYEWLKVPPVRLWVKHSISHAFRGPMVSPLSPQANSTNEVPARNVHFVNDMSVPEHRCRMKSCARALMHSDA